jgi:hypothetical protein
MLSLRLARIAACATVFFTPAASAQVAFTPAKGGYSVVFPENPQEKEVALAEGIKSTVYSVNHSDAAFLAGYTEYSKDKIDVEKEIVADVNGFAQQIDARVTERKRIAIRMNTGGRVELVEFSFEGDKSSGRGVLVIPDEHSTIMIAALSLRPTESRAAVDEFVKSFKLKGQE